MWFVILLAEPEQSSLAAKKWRPLASLEKATPTPKNRVWGFAESTPGRLCSEPDLSWETAAGSVQFTYENVSGRPEFISRDPLSGAEFSQGTNLYAYCGNDFLNASDPTGMDLYQVTHTDEGAGTGHAALISGSGDSYQYQSYGSNTLGSSAGSSSSNGGVSTAYFNNLGDALQYAADKGYDQVNQWHTNSDQDAAAQQAVSNENSQSYNLVTNNCQTAIDNGLNAAGVTYNNSIVPSIAAKQDQSLSDNHYPTPTITPPAKSKSVCSGSSS